MVAEKYPPMKKEGLFTQYRFLCTQKSCAVSEGGLSVEITGAILEPSKSNCGIFNGGIVEKAVFPFTLAAFLVNISILPRAFTP